MVCYSYEERADYADFDRAVSEALTILNVHFTDIELSFQILNIHFNTQIRSLLDKSVYEEH